jgi:hydroxyacylglutathione hydrolase
MNLFDNFYIYLWKGKDNNCNTCLFANVLRDGKHMVVDPGHALTPSLREPALERLARDMAGDGIDFSSIGLIVLTHGHPDHCEAALVMQQQFRAPIAMHRADAEMLQQMGGRPDFFLQEGILELGKDDAAAIQVLHSPGHSPGHITLYWPHRKVLIGGDCVFYRSTGRTDFPGGSADQLRESIGRMSQLDIEHLLCGHPYGHSGLIRGKEEIRKNFELILKYL